MTDRELMQQALEAFEYGRAVDRADVMKALRTRLAQPDTELPEYVDRRHWKCDPMTGEPLVDGWPLYSGLPQREWQGLTSAERKILFLAANNAAEFGKMVEAKLKEKNA